MTTTCDADREQVLRAKAVRQLKKQASAGTPASSTTSAVPRADPVITAVPRSSEGRAAAKEQ